MIIFPETQKDYVYDFCNIIKYLRKYTSLVDSARHAIAKINEKCVHLIMHLLICTLAAEQRISI